MSYELYFPESEVTVLAVVRDLSVDFTGRVDSIRLRSTETAVNGLRRAFPDAVITERPVGRGLSA